MRRIWIVDDESNIGLSLRMILEREGFAVTAFTSASDFRRATGRDQVALFLLDVRIPDASGIEVLREIRASGVAAPALEPSSFNVRKIDSIAEPAARNPAAGKIAMR